MISLRIIKRNKILLQCKKIFFVYYIKVDKIKNEDYTKFVNEKYVTVRSCISFDLCFFFVHL